MIIGRKNETSFGMQALSPSIFQIYEASYQTLPIRNVIRKAFYTI